MRSSPEGSGESSMTGARPAAGAVGHGATYIVKRLLFSLPALFLVSFIIFSLVRIVPGDVVIARVAESGYFSEEDLDEIRTELGLDRPFIEQYRTWLWNVSHGDLGRSLWSDEPVLPAIIKRLRVSAQLAFFGMAMAVLISIPLGVLSAVRRDSPVDYGARLFAILGLSYRTSGSRPWSSFFWSCTWGGYPSSGITRCSPIHGGTSRR